MQCWGDAMAKNPYGYPEFIKSTGYGTGAGLKGWNCYHDFHPFIPGVDTPNYTEEEVAQMNAEENIKRKFGDKEYTAYEATQRQRELERVMRKYGEETHLLELGGADDDTVLATKVRYQTASQEYAAFSKAMGLPQQRERIRNGMESLAQYADTAQKPLDFSVESGIIGAEDVKPMIQAIEQPIEQRHTGKGNPNAIITFDVPLNNRQMKLLDRLPDFDSRVTVGKDEVNMADLSALTAKTGHEFALFTKGNERLVIRGNAVSVRIDVEQAKMLAQAGYRWSGHTHPGDNLNCLMASAGDKLVLEQFPQNNSVIYNSKGIFATFGKEE